MLWLLFLSGNTQPILFMMFIIYSIIHFSLRNGVFMLTNSNRKKNRIHTGQLQAVILCLCLITSGIFGLTGCSNASKNVNNTIYLETTRQTAGSDDTTTLPADNETESGTTTSNPGDSTGESESAETLDNTTAEASTEVTATVAPVSVKDRKSVV